MVSQVSGCVPVVYVTDVALSVRFYELLSFSVLVQGQDSEWRWCYLRCGDIGILLAAGGSVWTADPGPVLLYLRVTDADAVQAALRDAGSSVEHLGYPDHAPGGELKVLDPDGHGLLLGQVTGAPPADYLKKAGGDEELTNVLVRAAAAARRRGVVTHRCQFPKVGGEPCPADAEIKVADSWGDSTWACLAHAEEIMINAKGAFIAAEDSDGLAQYLRRRQGLS